jgi:hypothetical protein
MRNFPSGKRPPWESLTAMSKKAMASVAADRRLAGEPDHS